MLSDAIGIRGDLTIPKMQSGAFQELVNKIAWAIGSTYRVPYSSPRREPRRTALALAGQVLDDQGWPESIGK